MTRLPWAFLLSTLLVLTSFGAAMARGQTPAVDRWVICTGHSFAVIYVDAEGNETSAPHLCPDCLHHLVALAAGADLGAVPAVFGKADIGAPVTGQVAHVVARHCAARGPPAMA